MKSMDDFKSRLINITQQKSKKFWLILGGVVVIILFFMVQSSHNLSRVIPGHAYYIPTLNKYIAFGKGKDVESMILLPDKETAIRATKSNEEFERLYEGNTVVEGQEEGIGNEGYTISDKQIILTAKQTFTPDTDNFADGGDTAVVSDFWGSMAASILAPMIKSGINDAYNSTNLQTADIRIDLKNIKVSGLSTHKIKCNIVTGDKSESTVLQEVK